jgi:hypothetical protein
MKNLFFYKSVKPGDAFIIRNIYMAKNFGKSAICGRRSVHEYKYFGELQLAMRRPT